MKRKILRILTSIIAVILLVIFFVPFPNVSHNTEGKFQYCRYRLAVYKFSYIEAEGEGYGKSDTYIHGINFREKIGGPLEYFGLKEIKKPSK